MDRLTSWPRALALVSFVALFAGAGCSRRSPTPSEADAAANREHVAWRGQDVGLELFENGDFELAILPASAPKVLVMGRARRSAGTIDLDVTRIWRARSTKDAAMGEVIEAAEAFGHKLERGKPATLRLRGTDASSLELCAESCTRVEKRTPGLAGEWRRRGAPAPGGLLRLDLDRRNVRLEWQRARGDEAWSGVEATSTGPDRFRLTLPADKDAGPHTFELHRLPDETLDVCDGPTCNVFERNFNAYHYDVASP